MAETTQHANPDVPVDENATEQASESLLQLNFGDWLPEAAQPAWQYLEQYPLLLLATMAALGYLLGVILRFISSKVLLRLTHKTKTDIDDKLVELASRPIVTTTVIVAMILALGSMGLEDSLVNILIRILSTILLLSWVRAAFQAVRVLLQALARNHHRFELIQEKTIPLFDMVTKVLLVGAAAYLLMVVWGINPTAWLASAGVIGIAVGFAAKDTLANLFSGVFIVADSPYAIGDYVVLDSGERGKVTQVGMRSTRLLTRDDVEIIIPNAVMANAKIINESGGPWEKERIRIKVGVAYDSDVDQVCELLKSVAMDHSEMLKDPSPRVRMRAFGGSSLDFELMGWIDHPELRGRISHELHMSIFKAFQEAGISIPFPQQDVYIKNLPEGGKEE